MSAPNVCEMMRAIRGQPNRGFRDFSSTMAWMSAASGPFGPGFRRHVADENSRRYLRRTNAWVKCEESRGSQDNGDLLDASGAEEERPESEEEPVAQRQPGAPDGDRDEARAVAV
jgi:hypothetical protein